MTQSQRKQRTDCTNEGVPPDWEVAGARGVGPFEDTQVVYRLPDGSRYVWEARRERRGRGPRKPSGQVAEVASYAEGVFESNPWLGVWAPRRISWWVAIIFIAGSLLFVLGALISLFPQALGMGLSTGLVIDLCYWLGALLYTGSIYLWLLEGINYGRRISTLRQDWQRGEFWWLGWRPARLAFMVPFLFLIGSLLWNLETTLALAKALGWVGKVNPLLTLSSITGSVLFLVPSYLQLVEVCHAKFCWQPQKISWWLAALFIVGSAGFVVGAVAGFGFIGLTSISDPLIVKLGYLSGSVLYLVGSYLMLPELAKK